MSAAVWAVVVWVGVGGGLAQRVMEPDRVGRILIEGNTDTPSWFILMFVDLRPGQILHYPRIAEAQKQLADLRHFDPADPPAVEVTGNDFDSRFKDVRVRVKERPGAGTLFALLDTVEAVVSRPVDVLFQTAVAVVGALR